MMNRLEIRGNWNVLKGKLKRRFLHALTIMIYATWDEHTALEDDLADFAKQFKDTKHEVFKLTEQIARTEKAKHLLPE